MVVNVRQCSKDRSSHPTVLRRPPYCPEKAICRGGEGSKDNSKATGRTSLPTTSIVRTREADQKLKLTEDVERRDLGQLDPQDVGLGDLASSLRLLK